MKTATVSLGAARRDERTHRLGDELPMFAPLVSPPERCSSGSSKSQAPHPSVNGAKSAGTKILAVFFLVGIFAFRADLAHANFVAIVDSAAGGADVDGVVSELEYAGASAGSGSGFGLFGSGFPLCAGTLVG